MKKVAFVVALCLFILILTTEGVVLFMQYKRTHIKSKNELGSLMHIDINDRMSIRQIKADEEYKGFVYVQFQVQKEYFNESEFAFGDNCRTPEELMASYNVDHIARYVADFDADFVKISYVKFLPCDYVRYGLLWRVETTLQVNAYVEAEDPDNDYVNIYIEVMPPEEIFYDVESILAS